MGLCGIDEVDERAIEGQATGMYGAGFAAGSLTRIGAKDRSEGLKLVLTRS